MEHSNTNFGMTDHLYQWGTRLEYRWLAVYGSSRRRKVGKIKREKPPWRKRESVMSNLKFLKFTKIEQTNQDREHLEEMVWKCYSCGNDSDKEGFHTSKMWTDYGYEYDCVCNSCGSDDTAAFGEGEPSCSCGSLGWDCFDCNKFCCEECWGWKEKREIHEEEEYICNECF